MNLLRGAFTVLIVTIVTVNFRIVIATKLENYSTIQSSNVQKYSYNTTIVKLRETLDGGNKSGTISYLYKVNTDFRSKKHAPGRKITGIRNVVKPNLTIEHLWDRSANNRIVGGHKVNIEEYPYIVSVHHWRGHICGGTLIKPDWVLTAMHCIQSPYEAHLPKHKTSGYWVIAGETNVLELPLDHPGRRQVFETYPYAEHNRSHIMEADIGLMRLVKAFVLGANIQLVQLEPSKRNNFPASHDKTPTRCTAIGWGRTTIEKDENNKPVYGEQLFAVHLSKIDIETCRASYAHLITINGTSQLCTLERGKDSCSGDSGGPLMSDGLQVGVASFGVGCTKNPAVYARVEFFLPWIWSTITEHEKVVVTLAPPEDDDEGGHRPHRHKHGHPLFRSANSSRNRFCSSEYCLLYVLLLTLLILNKSYP